MLGGLALPPLLPGTVEAGGAPGTVEAGGTDGAGGTVGAGRLLGGAGTLFGGTAIFPAVVLAGGVLPVGCPWLLGATVSATSSIATTVVLRRAETPYDIVSTEKHDLRIPIEAVFHD